jgi:hypothetical protein
MTATISAWKDIPTNTHDVGHRGGGGLTKMPPIVGSAYTKAPLTHLDPRQLLFFDRNAVRTQAGTEYIARLRERTAMGDNDVIVASSQAHALAERIPNSKLEMPGTP